MHRNHKANTLFHCLSFLGLGFAPGAREVEEKLTAQPQGGGDANVQTQTAKTLLQEKEEALTAANVRIQELEEKLAAKVARSVEDIITVDYF